MKTLITFSLFTFTFSLCACVFAQAQIPDMFVVRGNAGATSPIPFQPVVVSLYATKAAATNEALWTKIMSTTMRNGCSDFAAAVEVDDAAKTIFAEGKAKYIGIKILGKELPRQEIMTVPLVDRALTATGLSRKAEVGTLAATNATLSAGSLTINGYLQLASLRSDSSNGLDIAALMITATEGNGLQLKDNSANSLISSKVQEQKVTLKPGMLIVAPGGQSEATDNANGGALFVNDHGGILMLSSTEGLSMPAVTVPIGYNQSFTWPQNGYTGETEIRFFAFGK